MNRIVPLTAVAMLVQLAIMSNVPALAVEDVVMQFNRTEGLGGMNGPVLKSLSLLIFLGVPIVLVAGLYIILNNRLVSKEEAVMMSWAQVETSHQRRADLIPNLVATVTRYAEHERKVLESVTVKRAPASASLAELTDELKAAYERSQETMGNVTPDTAEAIERAIAAQTALGQALRRLVAVSENYPELRSSEQFLTLQSQIEGSENRINVARIRFNEAVGTFNASIRNVPASIVASIGGFRRKAYFQADSDAAQAVSVFQ
ncbi:MAG: LemA family protein [Alphaproteobacteria bacterium]|nr:LemA family protein [Alphaproteobacteria bacterium]